MSGKSLPARWASAFARRVPPRRWPLLGLGIGLALGAFVVPRVETAHERHRESEILGGLTASEPDQDHGPRFWFPELERETELADKALALCEQPDAALKPGCRLLHLLEKACGEVESPLALPPTPPADLDPEGAAPEREMPWIP